MVFFGEGFSFKGSHNISLFDTPKNNAVWLGEDHRRWIIEAGLVRYERMKRRAAEKKTRQDCRRRVRLTIGVM